MNAKKLSVTLSVLVLGLTSCGSGKSLTRQEAYKKLDEIVAATPAAQTKLTATNNTMADVTDNSGNVTSKAGVLSTYVFDAEKNYAHVIVNSAKTVKDSSSSTTSYAAGSEFFAYKNEGDYVFGMKYDGKEVSATVTSTDTLNYVAASKIMENFAQKQIDAFVKCGREHWHNGAGGLSAYLKRQDTLDQSKKDIVVGSETIQAGATSGGSYIVLKDEKYSTTGDGNLTLDFDALYPNPDAPEKLHEPLKFEFNNNLLTHWYNKKASNYAGNEWTMNYGSANIAACSYAAGDSEVALYVTVPTIIASLVAVDQPTSDSASYKTVWGA